MFSTKTAWGVSFSMKMGQMDEVEMESITSLILGELNVEMNGGLGC